MKAAMLAVLLSIVSGAPAVAATFVYVSNAEDDDIGMYTLQPDGSLQPGERFKAEKLVMPMAVSALPHCGGSGDLVVQSGAAPLA